jgi:pimeloyl-ACP methyl ester carboxylesterase
MNPNTFRRAGRIPGLVLIILPILSAHSADYLDQYFESNGAQIRYVERGAGEPVALIPRRGGAIEEWIDCGAFELPYHLIALDRGRNGNRENAATAGEDVIHLLDRLRTPRAHVVGYSTSADIVAYLSKVHPDRLLTAK